MLKEFVVLVLLAYSFPPADGKVYKQCELAKELLDRGFHKTFLANWICLAKHESDLNTESVVPNRNRSKQYGIFGINNNLYCKENRKGGLCDKNCRDFIDDDISDDAQCAQKILEKDGFKSWPNWKRSCSLNANLPNLRVLWICLTKHESGFDTASIVPRRNLSKRYGLFGINSNIYCKEDRKGGFCNKTCEDFTDDDISDDVECAKYINYSEGFKYWIEWERSCKDSVMNNVPNLRVLCSI